MSCIKSDIALYREIQNDLNHKSDWKVYKDKDNMKVMYMHTPEGLSTWSECVIKAPFKSVLFMYSDVEYFSELMPEAKNF